jgi:MOSC domain-containing protein YiiM
VSEDPRLPVGGLVSVNVGLPRQVPWQGTTVRTSIYKSPVAGAIRVGKLNLEGDQQSDPSVHGGVHKAVYVYPSEHYAWWRAQLDLPDLAWGAFGENLTVAGLTEAAVMIGDRLRVGTAELQVTQPRLPCYKLGIRFGRPDMEKRFLQSGRTGYYLSVVCEGALEAGDAVALVARAEESMSVAEVVALHRADRPDADLMRRAAELAALPPGMRDHFRKLLAQAVTAPPR